MAVAWLVAGLAVVAPAGTAAAAPASTLCAGYAACSRADFTTHGYPEHASRSYWTMYPGDNCTNYVAYVESSVFGVPTPAYNLGDGGAWAAAAAAHRVPVNGVPSVGAVAVWSGGSPGIPYPGHVGVVEYVDPRGRYIVVSQQSISSDPDGYEWTRIDRDPSENAWEQWPDHFVHFAGGPGPIVDGVHYGRAIAVPEALDTAGGELAIAQRGRARVWHVGLAARTSPAITLAPRGYEVAFVDNRGELQTAGALGTHHYMVRAWPGTSPSIAAATRGAEIALHAADGRLVTVGADGTRAWGERLAPGTSPSITALFGGGYEVAFESAGGELVTVGSLGHRAWHVGLERGTSPSIAAVFRGGYEVAATSTTGHLVVVGTSVGHRLPASVRPGTSPSITGAFDGGFEVAFESRSGLLEALGSLGDRLWRLRAHPGTSPSITALYGGGFEVVVQSSAGRPVAVGTRGVTSWRLRMAPGSSPSA